MESIQYSFVRRVEQKVIQGLKLFFGKYPDIEGLENIGRYRWIGDYNTWESNENTNINIVGYYPQDVRFYPCIVVNVSLSNTKEMSFGQYIESGSNGVVIGGRVFIDIRFTIQSLSGIDIELITDMFIIGAVAESFGLRKYLADNDIAVGGNREILIYSGESIGSLVSGQAIQRSNWKYNTVYSDWYKNIEIDEAVLAEIYKINESGVKESKI